MREGSNFILFILLIPSPRMVIQKVHLVFSVQWLSQCLVVFNVIQNNFIRLYCDSCLISMHL